MSKKRKRILYVSGSTTCEGYLVESLLETVFKQDVIGFAWDKPDLEEGIVDYNPCCVIMSPPLTLMLLMKAAGYEKPAEMWNVIRTAFPKVPVLWVIEDKSLIEYLPKSDSATKIMITDERRGRARRFLRMIISMIKIKPSFESLPRW